MNTIPWFLAIVVVFLCRKSLLIFAMRLCSFVILALVFLELLLPFCCRDNFFCSLANCFRLFFKLLTGSTKVLFEKSNKLLNAHVNSDFGINHPLRPYFKFSLNGNKPLLDLLEIP